MRSDVRRYLFALVLIGTVGFLASCGPTPTMLGEGPPPGYITGNIPDNYKGMRDPFTTSDQLALEAGGGLYNQNCSICHGDKGRGDGPKSPYLEPRPADFASPAMLKAFRKNQDYVFWWVSEGVVQTSMAGWGDRLSETQRWQVITYSWYLGEQGAEK